MSRTGWYEMDDRDQDAILRMGRARGQIASATRGRRGQAFLRLALKALDNMEDKRLAAHTFGVGDGGCMCLMTSIATETGRGSVLTDVDLEDGETVCELMAAKFDVADVLVKDLVWDNEEIPTQDPAERWRCMRERIARTIQAGS